MRLRVVRPLLVGGVRHEIGDVFELENGRAIEAIATGRAERAGEEPPPASGPMTTESAAAVVPGKKRKFAQKEDTNVAS